MLAQCNQVSIKLGRALSPDFACLILRHEDLPNAVDRLNDGPRIMVRVGLHATHPFHIEMARETEDMLAVLWHFGPAGGDGHAENEGDQRIKTGVSVSPALGRIKHGMASLLSVTDSAKDRLVMSVASHLPPMESPPPGRQSHASCLFCWFASTKKAPGRRRWCPHPPRTLHPATPHAGTPRLRQGCSIHRRWCSP